MTLHMEEWKNIINDDGNVDFFDYSISLINPIDVYCEGCEKDVTITIDTFERINHLFHCGYLIMHKDISEYTAFKIHKPRVKYDLYVSQQKEDVDHLYETHS